MADATDAGLEPPPRPMGGFGQVVLGPPGSGKSTYCAAVAALMRRGGRKVALVNLDPANERPGYEADVDVSDLASLESVQRELGLGPNGALLYCADHLAANRDWLREKLEPLLASQHYLILDCPGQSELYAVGGKGGDDVWDNENHTRGRGAGASQARPTAEGAEGDPPAPPPPGTGLLRVLRTLTESWNVRMVAVHLVDAHLVTDAGKYVSALLLSLTAMLALELPQINVLSKFDTLPGLGRLAPGVVAQLRGWGGNRLADAVDAEATGGGFRELTRELVEVLEDFSLVQFQPLAVNDPEALAAMVSACDKANGFVWAGLAGHADGALPPEFEYGAGAGAQDKVWDLMLDRYLEGAGEDLLEESDDDELARLDEESDRRYIEERGGGT